MIQPRSAEGTWGSLPLTFFRFALGGMLPGLICSAPALGQAIVGSAASAPAKPIASLASAVAEAGCNCFVIPALTQIELVIDANLSSKISKNGDVFPIRLGKPIIIDGQERLPAGLIGQGEVVHAKKSGGMGASGELVLAARFFTIGDRQLRLRSMRFGVAGKDAINSVTTVNALSVAAPLPIGMLGYFVTGQNIAIPNGTIASAKTSEAFSVPNTASAEQASKVEFASIPVVQTAPSQDRK